MNSSPFFLMDLKKVDINTNKMTHNYFTYYFGYFYFRDRGFKLFIPNWIKEK